MSHVAIVGAGPAGATLAYLLAQQGIEVTLIEAASSFDRIFRGEGLMPGGIYALEQMGLLSLLQQIPHRQIHAWEFVVDDRTVLHVKEPEALGVYRPTIIPQPAFLQAVVTQAKVFPSFQFLQGTVQELVRDRDPSGTLPDRIRGVVVKQAGRETILPATLVIGADGRGSTVRRLANLPLKKLDYDTDVLWLRLPAPLPEADRSTFYGFIRGAESLGVYTAWDDSLKFAYILPRGQQLDWKTIDWAERIASIAPAKLAEHVQANADALEPPVLLNVILGRCPAWHRPGVLLLGDAAHPMAPIRAQGINLALRDVIVAANHLTPLLQRAAGEAEIDVALSAIQAEREPEIRRCQMLQRAEQAQATRLCQFALLRKGLTLVAPALRPLIEKRWLARQQDLRFGIHPIALRAHSDPHSS
ncbi:FAD-dependent oxidoreductase [Phormidium tenue FACHB-886]|nr:FAD-dependent oxidoreductase [Phormidium tenue FACHB-886]